MINFVPNIVPIMTNIVFINLLPLYRPYREPTQPPATEPITTGVIIAQLKYPLKRNTATASTSHKNAIT